MYVRVKREKLVSPLGIVALLQAASQCLRPSWLLCKPASQAATAAAAAAAPTHPCQTVFLHVDPTDTVSMLKQKLQELLQKVGQLRG